MSRHWVVHQGHLYQHGVRQVIALQSGSQEVKVRVLPLDPEHASGLGRSFWTHARNLVPLPMKYYNGQVPGAKK